MQILGAYGSKSTTTNLTSFLIKDEIELDCGNLINGLGDNIVNIKHILLTHTHFDHIADLPIMLDSYYSHLSNTIKIYSTKQNIDTLKFNQNFLYSTHFSRGDCFEGSSSSFVEWPPHFEKRKKKSNAIL